MKEEIGKSFLARLGYILARPAFRNFRKKVLEMGILDELNEIETDVSHRAARLYRFSRKRYEALVKKGFDFEL